MPQSYAEEAARLDREILACINDRAVPDFNDLALRVFAHQLRYNAPYARYCESRGVTLASFPQSWEAIPPVPSPAFKEAALCTVDPARAALAFETSGTTTGAGGKHYMESTALYNAALLAGFYDAMLADHPPALRYFLLVPNPELRPQSSLGYMMRAVSARYGDGREQWYLEGDLLRLDRFIADARSAAANRVAICIAGTAFAFVQLLDALDARGIDSLALAHGSRVMETGGFKGRTRIVERAELYGRLTRLFDIPQTRIVAEYGMTELTSQYYDGGSRVQHAPPWLRPRVVDPRGATVATGVVGTLVHVDLCNRSSCVAIQTEDLGASMEEGGIVLIGREGGAQLRGCSLDAEALRMLAAR
jgi:Acyl-protein synthetase, LuxE